MGSNASVWQPGSTTSISANTLQVEERIALVNGQEYVPITKFTYTPDVGSVTAYLDGAIINLDTDWEEVADGEGITLLTPATGGAILTLIGHVGISAAVPIVLESANNFAGLFSEGFSYANRTDFGVDANETQWVYVGAGPFPKVIAPGFVPSTPEYQVIHVNKHSVLSGRSEGDAHPATAITHNSQSVAATLDKLLADTIALSFTTVATMAAGITTSGEAHIAKVGQLLTTSNIITGDSLSSVFIVKSALDSSDTISVTLANGLFAVLLKSDRPDIVAGYVPTVTAGTYTYFAYNRNETEQLAGYELSERSDTGGAFTYLQKTGVKLNGAIAFSNTSISNQKISTIRIPAAIAQNADLLTIDLAHTNLPVGSIVSIGFSSLRNQEKYRMKKTTVTSDQLAFHLKLLSSNLITPVDVSYFTTMPNASNVVALNAMGNVDIEIYVQLPAAAPTCSLHSISISIPRSTPKTSSVSTLSCKTRPFGIDSVWNKQSEWVTRPPALTYSRVGKSETHASGTAGSAVITVATTQGVRVGDVVFVSNTRMFYYAPFNTYRNYSNVSYHADTISVIGAGVTVVSVDSDTQLTLSSPVLTTFLYNSGDYQSEGKIIVTAPARFVAMNAVGTNIWSTSPITGKTSSGTINPYSGVVDYFKLDNPKNLPTTPFTINYAKWVATNGLINTPIGSSNFGEELLNGSIVIDRPADVKIAYTSGALNSDRNVIIESPCGRYSIEMFYCSAVTDNSISCSRIAVIDKTEDIANSLYLAKYVISMGTRAYGGSLVAGLITEEEARQVPDVRLAAGDEDVRRMMMIAEHAIPHAIVIVPPVTTLKSNTHIGGTYHSVTDTRQDVVISDGGSGYKVHDIIYGLPTAGTYVEQPACIVVEVVSGVVTKAAWTVGGQMLNSVVAAMPSKSSGSGTGFLFHESNFSESLLKLNQAVWPASEIDDGYAGYNGAIQMGDKFTLDPNFDLFGETFLQLTDPLTESLSSFTGVNRLLNYAVMCAIKKYGAVVCDVTNNTNLFASATTKANSQLAALEVGSFNYPGAKRVIQLLVPCDNSSYYEENIATIDIAPLV